MAAGGIVAGDQGAFPAGLDRKRGKACRFYGTVAGTYYSFYFGCGLVCLIAFCWGGGFDTDVIGGRGRVEGCVIRIDCWDGSEGRGCGPSSDGDCDRGCSHDIDFCTVQLGLLA